MSRRGFLVAFLVYMALDLSLPAMPGAFVFDVAESVEGARMSRVRQAAELVVAPAPPRLPAALPEPPAPLVRPRPRLRGPDRLAGLARCGLPRAVCMPRSLGDDPH